MFAYCLNNPVNLEDITGSAARACFDDNDRLKENPWKDPISGGGAQSEVPSPSKSHKVLNNVEEHMTLHALKKQGYAFYNGVPVVKMPIDNRAFSLGFMIVVGENVNDPETLKHEWGHSLHFRHIGQTKYIKYTLIPSMIGYWSDVDWLLYYSQPWEYMAELFGKVNRPGYPYIDNAETIARIYFWATLFAPS